MTLREYVLKAEGYRAAQYALDCRLRLLCFVTAKPHLKDQHLSIYNFMPLDGDPTPAEIARIQQENLEIENAKAQEFRAELLKRYGYGGV